MTARTTCNLSLAAASTLLLLNLFSRPLGISGEMRQLVICAAIVPLVLFFAYLKKAKEEVEIGGASIGAARTRARSRLIAIWVCLVPFTLSFPFWLPRLSGVSLGRVGDFVISFATLLVVSLILWIQLRKLPNLSPESTSPSVASPAGQEPRQP